MSTDVATHSAMHEPHNMQYVSLPATIDKAQSLSYSSRFTMSATMRVQPTVLGTTDYVTEGMNAHDDHCRLLSDQWVNQVRATKHIWQDMINPNLWKSLEQAKK